MQATVLFKVFTLTLKTASKPLAAQFERYVMHHEVLRSKVIAIAQVRCEIGYQLGPGRPFWAV